MSSPGYSWGAVVGCTGVNRGVGDGVVLEVGDGVAVPVDEEVGDGGGVGEAFPKGLELF